MVNKTVFDMISSEIDKANTSLDVLRDRIQQIINVDPYVECSFKIAPFPYRKSFLNRVQTAVESDFLVLKINLEQYITEKITFPVCLDLAFYMPRKSAKRQLTNLHLVDPTLEALNKTVIQALIFADCISERNIVSINSSKRYSNSLSGEGYMHIKIYKLENNS